MFFDEFYMEKSIPKFSEFYFLSMTTFFFNIIFKQIFRFYCFSPPGKAPDPWGFKKNQKQIEFFMIFC